MATVKVKLRPSSVEGKPGTVFYSITHKGIIKHITTKIRLHPSEWDAQNQCLRSKDGQAAIIQNKIDSDVRLLLRIISELDNLHSPYSVDDIISRFRNPKHYVSVLSFLKEQIQFLKDCKRLGTALNYQRAANSLSNFLEQQNLPFSQLTSRWVEQYSEYLLRKGIKRNSLSFYMRILRAVYNKAVRRGYAEQTFPFKDVYTGIDKTRKRAVSESVISRLIGLNLDNRPLLSYARDLFLFSFYTRGMSFVDIAYLRKTDIHEGRICYSRHKTGQELIIRIEPCIQEIINRYVGNKTPYIFPILENDNYEDCFRRYKNELRLYDSRLEKISRLLGLDSNLSSYTSRHSWATMARNHNVPLSIISAGMGHSSERTTQIYLNSLENTLIDNANKGILETFTKSYS